MKELIDGLFRFQRDVFPEKRKVFRRLARSQDPSVLFVTCSDSRVVPELLTQSDPGTLFVIRNAGNIVPRYSPKSCCVAATVEYAVSVLKVRDIVICGHSDCGAMSAICTRPQRLPALASWLRNADAAKAANELHKHSSSAARLDAMARENVLAQLANLRTHPSVAIEIADRRINLHGWVFNIENGTVEAFDDTKNGFMKLTGSQT